MDDTKADKVATGLKPQNTLYHIQHLIYDLSQNGWWYKYYDTLTYDANTLEDDQFDERIAVIFCERFDNAKNNNNQC